MEVNQIQDVLHIHIFQLRHDGVFLIRRSQSVDGNFLVAVTDGEIFYLQMILAVDDFCRMHLPWLVSDMHHGWLDADVGSRYVSVCLVELRLGIQCRLDRCLLRVVVVTQHSLQGVVGSGCIHVKFYSVFTRQSFLYLCIHLQRVACGMHLQPAAIVGFAVVGKGWKGGVEIHGSVVVREISVDIYGFCYLQRYAQHALQNLGRGYLCLDGKVVVHLLAYLSDAWQGRQLAGYHVGHALHQCCVIVSAFHVKVCEGCFQVQIAVGTFVLGAYLDIVQRIFLVCHLHA